MPKPLLPFTLFSAVVLLLSACPVHAASAGSLVESGNKAFSQGDYTASMNNYDKAAEEEPDSAVILFNRGDVLYKQKKFNEALKFFEQAAENAGKNNNPGLEAQSLYNMGNSFFARGRESGSKSLEDAYSQYKRSSQYYESALRLDPNLSEAAHNLEAARIEAKKVEEQIRKQQQQIQEQKQQKKKLADELENLQQGQQHAAEQSRNLKQSLQGEKDAKEGALQSEKLAQEQRSITERTRQADRKLEELNRENAGAADSQAGEHMQRAIANQEAAQQDLQHNMAAAAHKKQQKAAAELQNALQQMKEAREEGEREKKAAGKNEEQNREAKNQKQQNPQAGQSKKKAQQETAKQNQDVPGISGHPEGESPEDIINEELENKKYQGVSGATGFEPVDKDW